MAWQLAYRLTGWQQHSCQQHQNKAAQYKRGRHAGHRTALTALHCPLCPQHGPRSLLPSPLACLLHYLKHSLVFICRAGDVASCSTFPSRAVYIREPIWLYKTRQQEGGGPEPERGETWKPFYGAAKCALDKPRILNTVWRNVKDIFSFISCQCSTLIK